MKKYIIVLFVFVLLVSGCVSSQDPTKKSVIEPAIKEFKVKVDHAGYTFYLNNRPVLTPTVNLGDTVKFFATTLTAELDHGHGITIDEFRINQVVLTANEMQPKTIEFIANKTGKFRIYCGTCSEGSFGDDHPDIEAEIIVK